MRFSLACFAAADEGLEGGPRARVLMVVAMAGLGFTLLVEEERCTHIVGQLHKQTQATA